MSDNGENLSWGVFASEYERRVEPFTMKFVKEMMRPLIHDNSSSSFAAFDNYDRKNKQNCRLMDVGCGTGAVSLLAVSLGFRQVTATDVSLAMVDRARYRITQFHNDKGECALDDSYSAIAFTATASDGQSLPADWSNSFDVCLASFSVIFFPDPVAGLKEMLRCLVPHSGVAAITAWGDTTETPAFQVFPDVSREMLSNSNRPKRITGSVATLEKLMTDAGFVDISVVGPVTHTLKVDSPEDYYDRFALTSPPTAAMILEMDDALRSEFRKRIMSTAAIRGGQEDGSIALDASAYIAYGRKAAQSSGNMNNRH